MFALIPQQIYNNNLYQDFTSTDIFIQKGLLVRIMLI